MKMTMAMRKLQNDTKTNTYETNAHLMSLIIGTCTVTPKMMVAIMLAMMRIIQHDRRTLMEKNNNDKLPAF